MTFLIGFFVLLFLKVKLLNNFVLFNLQLLFMVRKFWNWMDEMYEKWRGKLLLGGESLKEDFYIGYLISFNVCVNLAMEF